MPICFNCDNTISYDVKFCPFCGSVNNNIKENFIKYIGSEDSLAGYQKSYKLVLMKHILESLDNNKQASVSVVIEKIRLFYLDRVSRGLIADIDVDDRIKNIQNSNDYDVFAVMKNQPYKVINDKGFLYLNRNKNGDLVFVFNEDLSSSLTSNEIKKLLKLVNKKLQLYYDTKMPQSINQNRPNEEDVTKNNQKLHLETSVDFIDSFSSTLKNSLKRRGIFTINDVIEFDREHGYDTIHILGNFAFSEISKLIISFTLNNDNIKKCYIRHLFHESSWASFIRYCIDNNYVLLEDLDGFDFNILLLEKGFGVNKVEKIKNRYLEIIADKTIIIESNYKATDQQEHLIIHDSNKNLSISNLKLVGISGKLIKKLLEINVDTVGKLEGFSKVDLLRLNGNYKLEETFESLKQFSQSLIEISTQVMLSLKNDREFQIYIMRSEGFSLQEIADENSCTRERVRQIESKFDKKVSPIISSIIENYFRENSINYISTNEVLDFFDDDDLDKVIMYNLKRSDNYEFLSFAEIFLKKSSQTQNTTAKLYQLAKDFVGEGINLFDELDNLDDMLSNAGYNYIDADAFLNLLEECNAQFYGDYVLFGKKSYSFLCYKIVEEYFPNGINLYLESDIDRLRNLVHQKFGDVKLPDNDRAIATALSRYLIISGRGVANSINHIHFEYDTIQRIKDYIDDNPLNTLYFREIFNEFEGLLAITTSIDNYHCLHGVLQYCYPKDYTFSRDTLSKREGDGIKLSLEDRVNNILIQKGQATYKKTIIDIVGGCSESMLFNVAVTGTKIIIWDYCYYNSVDNLSITEDDECELRNLIQFLLTQNYGYCSDGLLFSHVQNTFPNFLTKNNIQNRTNLFYVMNYLFCGEFQFNRPHICSLEFPASVNAKEIMLHLLGPDRMICHSEFVSISKKMFWSEMTSGFVFSEIEKDTVRISEDKYLKKEYFYIDSEKLNAISIALKSLSDDLGVVSAINIYDFSKFPKIEYEWNSFLLVSIIEHYDIGFRVINPKNKDRRYQKSIIVEKDRPYTKFDEVVVEYLRKNNIMEISENNFLSFLILNGLVRKVIPKELQESQIINYEEGMYSI